MDRTSNTNIDDIYSDICKELGINNDKNNIIKQIESKTKNSKTPLKYSIPIKKNDENYNDDDYYFETALNPNNQKINPKKKLHL